MKDDKMEIKTGKEIVAWTRGKSISDMNIKPYNKEWIAIDDLIKYLDKESYGYRENGCNIINVDELREKLRKHR